jgi:hypothetical protein
LHDEIARTWFPPPLELQSQSQTQG